ncbi:hypothetical protein Tco_1284815 [Tanacetum coccineum]
MPRGTTQVLTRGHLMIGTRLQVWVRGRWFRGWFGRLGIGSAGSVAGSDTRSNIVSSGRTRVAHGLADQELCSCQCTRRFLLFGIGVLSVFGGLDAGCGVCMSTRSSSSNLIPPFFDPESVIQNRRRNLGDPLCLLDFEEINISNSLNINPRPPHAGPPPQNHNGPSGPNLHMPAPDLQMVEELCQPTMNGRGGPIAPVNIQATDFGLKNHMIQQVQNSCQFNG